MLLAFFTWRLARSTARSVDEAQRERKLTEQALEASNRLAGATERQSEASASQADASAALAAVMRDAVQASHRPLIADVPPPDGLDRFSAGQRPAIARIEFDDGPTIDYHYSGEVIVMGGHANTAFLSVPIRNIGTGPAIVLNGQLSAGVCVSDRAGKVADPVLPVGEITRITFTVDGSKVEHVPIIAALTNGSGLSATVVISYTDIGQQEMFRTRLVLADGSDQWYVRQIYFYRNDEFDPLSESGVRGR